ncbi:PRC-barrel domain-containing protein [Alkaliphilus peptidifermentans]|uniref:PRC-barrel domain-containing protein n=1 Tax=Alkaliphilus peptidifermentans DSM 18978 TaxID=1120976 RepID=A0A1G5EVR8_9FIRM|nr:PRC-barrel domain-containing protein [Alkaliphilus peptidifermentans]SCY31024.1 PRC-barrel domain-containing protein [Alkaliphilus peptidifermentans DSM 18978]
MVIKISEKPVISKDSLKALGTLKGLIFNNNKVTFLYCKFSDKYVYIPIKDAYIDSDAIMVKVTEDIIILHTDSPTKVYTSNGKEVGTVSSIEMDDHFNITGIIVDNLFIKRDKIIHMENIIIVDIDIKDMECPAPSTINSTVCTDIKDESADEDNNINLINHNLIIESSLASIQQLNDHHTETAVAEEVITDRPTEGADTIIEFSDQPIENTAALEEITESENNPQDNQEEFAIEIDERYRHLCGKRLLEDIVIVKETYNKGTIIDAALIQFAINNNSIVKVIMNTED